MEGKIPPRRGQSKLNPSCFFDVHHDHVKIPPKHVKRVSDTSAPASKKKTKDLLPKAANSLESRLLTLALVRAKKKQKIAEAERFVAADAFMQRTSPWSTRKLLRLRLDEGPGFCLHALRPTPCARHRETVVGKHAGHCHTPTSRKWRVRVEPLLLPSGVGLLAATSPSPFLSPSPLLCIPVYLL